MYCPGLRRRGASASGSAPGGGAGPCATARPRDADLRAGHRHDVAAEVRGLGVVRGADADVAGEEADFAALVDAEGDPAEVHEFELAVERDRVAADRGDGALLGLPGIEVGRGEDDLVALAPAGGVEDLDPRAAGFGGAGELGPGVLAVAVQAQRAAHEHDPAVAHGVDVLVGHLVGQGDRRVVPVGFGLAADLQLAAPQVDPLGVEPDVAIVREAELAVDRQAAQRGRIDVQDHVDVAGDDDGIAFAGHFPVGPGGGIGPAHRPDRCKGRIRRGGGVRVGVAFLGRNARPRAEREGREKGARTKSASQSGRACR